MPEENDKEKQVEEEMLKMMQAEAGEEAQPAQEGEAGKEAGDDLEAEMLRAMQEEMAAGGGKADDAALEAQMLQAMMEETGAPSRADAQEALQKTQRLLPGQELSSNNIRRLLDIRLSISIELGRTQVPISILLGWTEGSLIELDKVSGEPVDVLINGRTYAKGEVVVVSENFGVRLTEILSGLPPA